MRESDYFLKLGNKVALLLKQKSRVIMFLSKYLSVKLFIPASPFKVCDIQNS